MKTNLQVMRKRAGWKSAKAFAEHMGLNVGTYTNYEQGIRPYTIDLAWEFADELHCSLDELLGREWPRTTTRTPSLTKSERQLLRRFRLTNDQGRQSIESIASVQPSTIKTIKSAGKSVSEILNNPNTEHIQQYPARIKGPMKKSKGL